MSGHVHYLSELDEESFALLPDARILLEPGVLETIGDYTRSQPTGPSPGRVYRKNLGWPRDTDDDWFVYVCEAGAPGTPDEGYVLHHPHRVEVVT